MSDGHRSIIIIIIIIRPHRMQKCGLLLPMSLSVAHNHEPYKNGRTDQAAVRGVVLSSRPTEEPCIRSS